MEEFDQIEQKVRELIAEQFEIDILNIKKSSTIADLGGDSLLSLKILSAFENYFDISIPDDEAVNIDSFNSAVDIIKRLLKN